MANTLLSVPVARDRLLSQFHVVESEILALSTCAGRVLASDILSSDLPLFDNSSVDGFAVLASEVVQASSNSPITLKVVADIPAGSAADVVLAQGEAARIMTGALLPNGADAVVMVEDTDIGFQTSNAPVPKEVQALRPVYPGENVRRRGSDIMKGQTVLFAGHRLRAQDLGILAMLGVANVSIFRKPRVALLSSGDELTPVDQPLRPGRIRDSNSQMLSTLIVDAGCDLISLGIAPDNKDSIRFLLAKAVGMDADIIISSAGVSVGAFDLIKEVIESNGSLNFWQVNMRPGKPLAVGQFHGTPFIGLPGNPVSAFVGFEIFVRPALGRLGGVKDGVVRQRVKVRLAETIESDGRETYLRAIIEEKDGDLVAKLTGHQGSGNLFSLVQANALLIVPAGVKSLPIGSQADAWSL